jgi:hypothetical protein
VHYAEDEDRLAIDQVKHHPKIADAQSKEPIPLALYRL